MGEVISINRNLERRMKRLLEFLTPQQMALIIEWYHEHQAAPKPPQS